MNMSAATPMADIISDNEPLLSSSSNQWKMTDGDIHHFRVATEMLHLLICDDCQPNHEVVKGLAIRAGIVGQIHGTGKLDFRVLNNPSNNEAKLFMLYSENQSFSHLGQWVVRIQGEECKLLLEDLVRCYPEIYMPLELMLRIIGFYQIAEVVKDNPDNLGNTFAYQLFYSHYAHSLSSEGEEFREQNVDMRGDWLLKKANQLSRGGIDDAFFEFMRMHFAR